MTPGAMGTPLSLKIGGTHVNLHSNARYALLVIAIFIGLHTLLTLTQPSYADYTSFSHLLSSSSSSNASAPASAQAPSSPPSHLARPSGGANATILMLARNSDLNGVVQSMRELEDRWNRRYRYPWTFLNDEPFTEEFKTRVSVLTDAPVEFGLIPRDHWVQPDWIDEEKATKSREDMVRNNVIYGGSVPYRNMCRFNSGFFYRHELLQKYRWYWRVEPDVHFYCDVNHDPFEFMIQNNKTYGWTISMYEFQRTVPTLWRNVKEFTEKNPQFVADNNAMSFLTNNNGRTYNLCHFWSNFEIADMDFWRGEAYTAFFDYLDSQGGFYYERWGDAPVHSIAAALFLPKTSLHFFNDIAYFHNPFTHCPADDDVWTAGRCSCEQKDNFDYNLGSSCMRQWDRLW